MSGRVGGERKRKRDPTWDQVSSEAVEEDTVRKPVASRKASKLMRSEPSLPGQRRVFKAPSFRRVREYVFEQPCGCRTRVGFDLETVFEKVRCCFGQLDVGGDGGRAAFGADLWVDAEKEEAGSAMELVDFDLTCRTGGQRTLNMA